MQLKKITRKSRKSKVKNSMFIDEKARNLKMHLAKMKREKMDKLRKKCFSELKRITPFKKSRSGN
jgi:hypothetical protein